MPHSRDCPAKFQRIAQIQNETRGADVPRVDVLVAALNGLFRAADAFIAFECGVTKKLAQPGKSNDIVPECENGNAQSAFL